MRTQERYSGCGVTDEVGGGRYARPNDPGAQAGGGRNRYKGEKVRAWQAAYKNA